MFWLNIAVEVAAVVNELEDLDNVSEDAGVGQVEDVAFVLLHDQEVVLLGLVVVDAVNARPLCLGDVLPQPVVHVQHRIQLAFEVLYGHCLRVAFGVSVEDGPELGPLDFVVLHCAKDQFEGNAHSLSLLLLQHDVL